MSLLDAHFGFRAQGLDLEEEPRAASDELDTLVSGLKSAKGEVLVPREDTEIVPTPTQNVTLYLIMKALLNREPLLIAGNPASGKTTIIRHLARRKNTNLYYVNLSSDTGLEELLGGYTQDKKGKWHYRKGLLFRAMAEGSWLLIDEANLSPLSEYLNTLLDFDYVIDGEENVCYAHTNFRIFLSMNPPSVHQSRNLLSPALRFRFTEVWVEELTDLGGLAGVADTWTKGRGPARVAAKDREVRRGRPCVRRSLPWIRKRRRRTRRRNARAMPRTSASRIILCSHAFQR